MFKAVLRLFQASANYCIRFIGLNRVGLLNGLKRLSTNISKDKRRLNNDK
jgi:hypothetical protein